MLRVMSECLRCSSLHLHHLEDDVLPGKRKLSFVLSGQAHHGLAEARLSHPSRSNPLRLTWAARWTSSAFGSSPSQIDATAEKISALRLVLAYIPRSNCI